MFFRKPEEPELYNCLSMRDRMQFLE